MLELDEKHAVSLLEKEIQLLKVDNSAQALMIACLTHTLGTLTQEEPAAALANSGLTSPRSAPPPIMHAAQPTGQYFAPAPQVNPMGGQQLQLPAPAGWMQVPTPPNWNF